MEAKVHRVADAQHAAAGCNWRHVVFTLEHARRALPYVSRIAADAAAAYTVAQQCRVALGVDRSHESPDAIRTARAELVRARDEALVRLNAAIDECNATGADLIDLPQGIIRFASMLDGQPAHLYWQLGDPTDHRWPPPPPLPFVVAPAEPAPVYAATR